jgi:hypothetical protein
MNMGQDEALSLIDQSLRVVDKLGASPIDVRQVRMADRTLVIEFTVDKDDTTSLLGEVANVMGVLSGLDVPDLFPQLPVDHFGARAFDKAGQELVWVISSLEAAGFVAKGQPIEWLNRSMVQDNTPGYRRSQADRRVGQLETALRDLLHKHGGEHEGATYLKHLWKESEIKELEKAARKEGLSSDPRDLLDFTFLPQLVESVANNPVWFQDGCIPNPARFKSDMARLNKIRRKVAHHREISEGDLQTCSDVASVVLGPIGEVHPDLADDFLVDRWEDEVSRLISELQGAFDGISVADKGTVSESERGRQVIAAIRGQLDGVEATVAGLERLAVPPQRQSLHDATKAAMERWHHALIALAEASQKPGITVSEAEAAQEAYSAALAEVREMRQRIRAIRLGLET